MKIEDLVARAFGTGRIATCEVCRRVCVYNGRVHISISGKAPVAELGPVGFRCAEHERCIEESVAIS
jgi:hypothetical protein